MIFSVPLDSCVLLFKRAMHNVNTKRGPAE